MKPTADELIPTRASLLHRLKNWQDDASWRTFFNVYWQLIYGLARQAGPSGAAGQDVVQETLPPVAKHIPSFKSAPALGSFKAWLLNMTRWRIIGQFRKRPPVALHEPAESVRRTDTVNAVPDPNTLDLDAAWEAEWQNNLLQAALENLKRRESPQRLQVFEFYVNK